MPSHNLRLSDELFAAVNDAAGDVPRNTWIVRAIEGALAAGRSSLPVARIDADGRVWYAPPPLHGPQIKPLGKGYGLGKGP